MFLDGVNRLIRIAFFLVGLAIVNETPEQNQQQTEQTPEQNAQQHQKQKRIRPTAYHRFRVQTSLRIQRTLLGHIDAVVLILMELQWYGSRPALARLFIAHRRALIARVAMGRQGGTFVLDAKGEDLGGLQLVDGRARLKRAVRERQTRLGQVQQRHIVEREDRFEVEIRSRGFVVLLRENIRSRRCTLPEGQIRRRDEHCRRRASNEEWNQSDRLRAIAGDVTWKKRLIRRQGIDRLDVQGTRIVRRPEKIEIFAVEIDSVGTVLQVDDGRCSHGGQTDEKQREARPDHLVLKSNK